MLDVNRYYLLMSVPKFDLKRSLENLPRSQVIISLIFILLVAFVGALMIYVNLKGDRQTEEVTFKKDTPDLYEGIAIELNSPRLIRARFFELKEESLYVEYYYNEGRGVGEPGKPAIKEAITLTDNTVYDCVERYFKTPDGTSVDRFNMYLDTRNFNNNNVPEGNDIGWFGKNAEIGEAVEVRFIEEVQNRVAGLVLLYKDKCE